jgi:cystathionine gamma-synthase/methionine-gamma-lyase
VGDDLVPETSIFTIAVHAGERASGADFTPVATPIYPASSYVYQDPETLDAVFAGTRPGPVYARYGNPTNAALEAAVAALEGGEAALSYSSGMAAIYGALLGAGARAGCTVVAAHDVYGATNTLLRELFNGQGVVTHFVDVTDLESVSYALSDCEPVALLVETISNPLLKVADLPKLAELAHRSGAALIVDNTFATPYLCRPLIYGGGHGDVLGGVVVTSEGRRARLNELNKLIGSNLGPQEAWLILRGVKTLALRMQRQCESALAIAGWMAKHPKISNINYPGLPEHQQHSLAAQLLDHDAFGAVISFDLRNGDRSAVFRFLGALRLILPATTLGDVYSLVLYPAMSSHRSLPPEMRRSIGIGDGLVRLSVGIEDPIDIIADLAGALEAA